MTSLHISQARLMLNRPEPVDIKVWTRKGEIQEWKRVVSIKYEHYKGTRKMKFMENNQIRMMRECCLFEINGMEVYL